MVKKIFRYCIVGCYITAAGGDQACSLCWPVQKISRVVKGLQWVSMERGLKETFFPTCNSFSLNFEQPRK